VLLDLGLHMGKIQSLSHTANVAFAYSAPTLSFPK
jgi:hypothetical protein